MKDIRIQVVKFHLLVNRHIFNILRVIIFASALLLFILGLISGFKTEFYILVVATVLVNVLLSKSIQLRLAVKNIDKTFRKLSIDKFQVNFEADETSFTISTDLGVKTIQSHFNYSDIYTSQFDSKEDIHIFTSGKMASNYAKSRPRYIYLGNLDEEDKQILIEKFKSNSKKYLVDDKIEKLVMKEKSIKKNHNIRNVILFLVAIAVILTVSKFGVFNLFSYGTYPFDSIELVEEYDQYMISETETTFMVFGYIKDSDDLVLNSYFIDPTRDVVYSQLETKYCNVNFESISDDVKKCYGAEFQYGFNSHMSINLIIRLEKDTTIDFYSNDIDFVLIDEFSDYNYYIASYYGAIRDIVEFSINGKDYVIN